MELLKHSYPLCDNNYYVEPAVTFPAEKNIAPVGQYRFIGLPVIDRDRCDLKIDSTYFTILISSGEYCANFQLLRSYEMADGRGNWMLANFDWYILPVVNPDGYEYSMTTVNRDATLT